MSPHSFNRSLALAATLAGLGVLVGRCYFQMLRRSVARYASGRSTRVQDAALALARILCASLLFVAAARLGAVPLLAAFLGFLAARSWALHAARKAP
jgi:hypothetical protein